jgi:hypothetical protein
VDAIPTANKTMHIAIIQTSQSCGSTLCRRKYIPIAIAVQMTKAAIPATTRKAILAFFDDADTTVLYPSLFCGSSIF